MMIKIFTFIFNRLILGLNEEEKKEAKETFGKLIGIIVKNAAQGAVEGAK